MCFDQGHSVTREERGKAKRKGKYVRTGTMEGTAAQAKLNGERMYSVPNTFVEKRSKTVAREVYQPECGKDWFYLRLRFKEIVCDIHTT